MVNNFSITSSAPKIPNSIKVIHRVGCSKEDILDGKYHDEEDGLTDGVADPQERGGRRSNIRRRAAAGKPLGLFFVFELKAAFGAGVNAGSQRTLYRGQRCCLPRMSVG